MTLQLEEVVLPTVTVAAAAVLKLLLLVNLTAIVSPATKPETEVPPQLPLRAIAVQLLQVAVSGPSKLAKVTLFEVIVALVLTPV